MEESYVLNNSKAVNKGRLTYTSEETTNINLGQRGFDIITSIGDDEGGGGNTKFEELRLKIFKLPQADGTSLYRAFRMNNGSMVAQPAVSLKFPLADDGDVLELEDVDYPANPVTVGDYVLIQGVTVDGDAADIEIVKTISVNTGTNRIGIERGQLGTTARYHDFQADGSLATSEGSPIESRQYWVMMPGECTHWTTIKNVSGSIIAELQADKHDSIAGNDLTANGTDFEWGQGTSITNKFVGVAPGDTISGCFRTIFLFEPDAEATTSIYCLRG
tara:strand:+ start:66 stop:890 length:825 start_codon:yes stop_codon:yes gene_type:complete